MWVGCPLRRPPFLNEYYAQTNGLGSKRVHFPLLLTERDDRPYGDLIPVGVRQDLRSRGGAIVRSVGLRFWGASAPCALRGLQPYFILHVPFPVFESRFKVVFRVRYLTVPLY